jgi:hypothetical protein
MQLPATAIDDVSSCSVVLHNRSKEEQEFEFGVPGGSYIAVTPRVGRVPAKGSIRVQVEFSPPAELYRSQQQGLQEQEQKEEEGEGVLLGQQQKEREVQSLGAATSLAAGATAAAGAKAATPPAAVGDAASYNSSDCSSSSRQEGGGGVEGEESAAAEGREDDLAKGGPGGRWHHSKQWLLPCFFRPVLLAEQAPADTAEALTATKSFGNAGLSGYATVAANAMGSTAHQQSSASFAKPSYDSSSSSSTQGVLHLSVSTCAVLPELVLDTELERPPGKNYWLLDFGPVPVGERVVKSLLLKNTGEGLSQSASFLVILHSLGFHA